MFKLPRSLDDLLPASAVEKVLDVLHRPELYQGVKDAIGKVNVKDVNPLEKVQSAWQQTRVWLDTMGTSTSSAQSPCQVINATGQLFGESLGRPPIAPIIALAYAKSASIYRDEAQVHSRAQMIGQQCTGGKHVLWLNSVLAGITTFAKSTGASQILIARSDTVRIDNFGDIPLMLEQTGLPITEVGATNGASSAEWSAAVTGNTQLVVLVSPNALSAAAAAEQRAATLAAAKASGAPVLEILADGVLSDSLAEAHGLSLVKERLQSAVAAIVLPTHLLLGGPAGGLLVGNSPALTDCAEQCMRLGCTMQGAELTMATSAAQLHCSGEATESGTTALLAVNVENLRDRSQRMAVQLDGVGPISQAKEIERQGQLGPELWQRYTCPSWAVELHTTQPQELSRLLTSDPEFRIAAIATNSGLQIDLRHVPAAMDHHVIRILASHPPEDTTEAGHAEGDPPPANS